MAVFAPMPKVRLKHDYSEAGAPRNTPDCVPEIRERYRKQNHPLAPASVTPERAIEGGRFISPFSPDKLHLKC